MNSDDKSIIYTILILVLSSILVSILIIFSVVIYNANKQNIMLKMIEAGTPPNQVTEI